MGDGMHRGAPELRSVGPIGFGPDDVRFVADNVRGVVLAVDVADPAPSAEAAQPFDVSNLDAKLAALLNCGLDDIDLRDLAVHPRTRNAYVSVQRGRGDGAIPAIVRVDRLDGSVRDLA